MGRYSFGDLTIDVRVILSRYLRTRVSDWIQLTESRVQWRTYIHDLHEPICSIKAGSLLTVLRTVCITKISVCWSDCWVMKW
jgi:hypothetical protein